jgi:CHAT domain-containing protein/Tfp pilus assembly protein PilF
MEFLKNRFICAGVMVTAAAMILGAADCFGPASTVAAENEGATIQRLEALMAGADPATATEAQQEPTATEQAPQQQSDPAPAEKPAEAKPAPEVPVQPEQPEKKAEEKASIPEQQPPTKRNSSRTSEADRAKGGDAGALIKQAAELAKRDEYPEALEKYKQALNKLSTSGDQKLVASALTGAARALHHLGQDDEALERINRAIALHQVLKNAHARSLDFLLAGRILLSQGKYSDALKYFEESVKILPASESAELPKLLEDTAVCQLRLHKLSESLNTYNRLLGFHLKNGNDREAARLNLLVGEIQISRSDHKSAKVSFKKAEKIYRDLNLQKELGETLFRLAYVEQSLGDLSAAKISLEEGQTILGDGESGTAALPLMVRGIADYNDGKLVQAVKNLNAALSGYDKAGDRAMAARVRLILANLELDRARLTSALELAGKSLEEFRNLSSTGGEAESLHVIGDVYFRQGFVQKALEYVRQGLSLAKKLNDKNQMIQSRILLADIYTGSGDPESASKLLKESVEDVKTGANRRLKGQLKIAIARFRLSRESSEKALQDAAEARKDFSELNDRRGVADSDHLMGLVHELRGEREKAFNLLETALKEHVALADRFGEGRDLTALGVHYKNLGDHEKALDYFTKSLDLRKGIGDMRGYAANLANIGNLLRHRSQLDDALQKMEQALSVYRELGDKKGEADILTNLANVDAARANQPAALEKFTAALKLHREIQDNRGVATDLAGMGKIYLVKGDFKNASECLEEAGKINKRILNPRGEVTILSELAMLQRSKGNSRQALSSLERALEQAKTLNDPAAVASINLRMAAALEDMGEYPRALDLLRETLDTMKRLGDRKGELWALGSIGIIQVKTEDYENALTNLQEALKLRSELGLPDSQSRDLDFYIGEIYEGFRDLERALEHYQKALAVSQTPGNDSTLARVYDRIGNIYYRMDEFSKAKDFFEDALRIHADLRDAAKQKAEMIRLGDILSKLGDTEGALKYQQKALALARDTKDERTEGRVLTRIGTLNQIQGRQRQALENYKEAHDVRSRLGDRRGVNENLLQIAMVTSSLGDFDAAVADLKRAFEIAHCSEDRSMLWKAYFIMGRTLEGQKKPGEALESYRKAIAILEDMESDIIEESDEDNFIFGGKTALFDTTLRVLMRLAKRDPEGAYDGQALRIVEKLKAAEFENTLSRINVDNFSDLPHDLLIKEKSLKHSLRRLNTRLAEELSKGNRDQAQVQKILEERRTREKAFKNLKNRLLKEYPSYADLRYPRPVSVHQLQKETVDQDEAILEYMVTRGRIYIFALDKHHFYTYSIECPIQDIQRDVEALTRPLVRAETQASWDPSVAYRLYSRIIKPVESFLTGRKIVTIIPHGPLASLPFEVLVDSKAHATKRFWSASDRPSYLVEKYAFCYAPSASVLSQVRARKTVEKPGWNLLAFGDAIYNETDKMKDLNPGADRMVTALTAGSKDSRGHGLKSLPGARKEISEIVKIMGGPTQTYLGAEATESLFKKIDLSRYSYVHLATHGVLLSGAGKVQQQPAIVFSLYGDHENDGFLQLGEVFGLKLNSDLVVLSSCLSPGKSAAGETNGLVGLARAFLFAGTDSIIMSMWQVNDESTAKLFISMYRNLKAGNGSKAEALRDAKLSLLGNQSTSHPYYWAPFVLMGNWQMRFQSLNKPNPSDMRFKGVSSWRKLLSM